MSLCCSLSTPKYMSIISQKSKLFSHGFIRASSSSSADVPDFLSADWLESRRKRPFGPRLNFSAEEAVKHQLDALKYNDQPRQDYGIEVMYRFAGFDPFERSKYFGPFFDLGQANFSPFNLSSIAWSLGEEDLEQFVCEGEPIQTTVWILGSRPEEEEIFEFTIVQNAKDRVEACSFEEEFSTAVKLSALRITLAVDN